MKVKIIGIDSCDATKRELEGMLKVAPVEALFLDVKMQDLQSPPYYAAKFYDECFAQARNTSTRIIPLKNNLFPQTLLSNDGLRRGMFEVMNIDYQAWLLAHFMKMMSGSTSDEDHFFLALTSPESLSILERELKRVFDLAERDDIIIETEQKNKREPWTRFIDSIYDFIDDHDFTGIIDPAWIKRIEQRIFAEAEIPERDLQSRLETIGLNPFSYKKYNQSKCTVWLEIYQNKEGIRYLEADDSRRDELLRLHKELRDKRIELIDSFMDYAKDEHPVLYRFPGSIAKP